MSAGGFNDKRANKKINKIDWNLIKDRLLQDYKQQKEDVTQSLEIYIQLFEAQVKLVHNY